MARGPALVVARSGTESTVLYVGDRRGANEVYRAKKSSAPVGTSEVYLYEFETNSCKPTGYEDGEMVGVKAEPAVAAPAKKRKFGIFG
jgi:hypothetical protein